MSLINDLLKDLERRPHAMSSENLLAGLRGEISSEFTRNKKYYQIIGVLIIILLLTCAAILNKQHHLKVKHLKQSSAPSFVTSPTSTPVAANAQNTDIKRFELNPPHKAPELQKDIVNNNQFDKMAAPPPIIKKAIAETMAEQKYQFALRLSNAGQTQDAMDILKQLLIDYPFHSAARESLTAFLMQDGDTESAEQVLDEGLKLQKDFPAFIQLKARLLAEEGKLDEAIMTLEKNQPNISDDPEYYVLLAALYQRAGKASLAVTLYKQLLAMEPSNAKWWLGLGISLEASGNRNQATEAFANADNIGGLSPELKAYLDTKMSTLG